MKFAEKASSGFDGPHCTQHILLMMKTTLKGGNVKLMLNLRSYEMLRLDVAFYMKPGNCGLFCDQLHCYMLRPILYIRSSHLGPFQEKPPPFLEIHLHITPLPFQIRLLVS